MMVILKGLGVWDPLLSGCSKSYHKETEKCIAHPNAHVALQYTQLGLEVNLKTRQEVIYHVCKGSIYTSGRSLGNMLLVPHITQHCHE